MRTVDGGMPEDILAVTFDTRPYAPYQKAVPCRPDRSRRRGKRDRKSTRLNSSHLVISYAVFCLKKKNKGYLNIYDNYFPAPWMPGCTEAHPNALTPDDGRSGFLFCPLYNIWSGVLLPAPLLSRH